MSINIWRNCQSMTWQFSTDSTRRASCRSFSDSSCFKRSLLYSLFKYLLLFDNMRLQALLKNPHVTQDALEFRGYLLQLGEGKMQSDEKLPLQVHASVKILRDSNQTIETSSPICSRCSVMMNGMYNKHFLEQQTSAFRN